MKKLRTPNGSGQNHLQNARKGAHCQPEQSGGFRAVKPRQYGTTEDVVTRAFDEIGGAKKAAEIFDITAAVAYAMTDPSVRGEMSLSRAFMLTRYGAKAIAEAMADAAGGVFVPVETPDDGELIKLVAAAQRKEGHFSAQLTEALADGIITDVECVALHQVLSDLITTLTQARVCLPKSVAR